MAKNNLKIDSIISEVYQDKSSLNNIEDFLRGIVYEIFRRSGYKFSLNLPTPVEKIRALLGLSLTYDKELPMDAQLIKGESVGGIEITAQQVYPDRFTERGRFSVAHEIAHLLIQNISKKLPEMQKSFERKNTESLCDFIAGELLVPTYLFANPTSLEKLLGLCKKKLNKDYANDLSLGSFLLSVQMLEMLRRSLNVSRFALIHQLDRTPLLDETECGIIISFFNVNRNTGRSPALRVYYTALPSWGFIPKNIKLSNIGLTSAIQSFNSLGYGIIRSWKEKVKVNEKLTDKWISQTVEMEGEHVLYSFVGQHNYLITTLKWTNPEKRKQKTS